MGYKRVEITGAGNAEVVRVVEVPTLPEPGPGEVRIRVEASSAAFTDMLIRRSQYPPIKTQPGLVLGYDLVGYVDRVGSAVTDVQVGDRVADLIQVGGNAEYVCLPARNLVRVPEGLDAAEVETLILSYVTAYQMLHRTVSLQSGQRILIQGATGAVGLALLQLGRLMGLQMVGTASTAHQQRIQEYGAIAIDYQTPHYRSQLKRASEDGFAAIFEGGSSLSPWDSLNLLSQGGTLVIYGFTGLVRQLNQLGSKPSLYRRLMGTLGLGGSILQSVLLNLLPSGKSIRFYSISDDRRRYPEQFQADLTQLFQLLATGQIKPTIARQFSLEEAPLAHQLLDTGGIEGRLVIRL